MKKNSVEVHEESKATLKELIKLGALSREDINNAVLDLVNVDLKEIRPIVNEYYSCQKLRIAEGNQLKQLGDNISPNSILNVFFLMGAQREKDITTILSKYCETHPVLQWMTATKGIGPIIACMLGANLNFDKAKGKDTHASHFWSYCGLNVQNNPWLGSDKARKSVKEIYEELNDIVQLGQYNIELLLDDNKDITEFRTLTNKIYQSLIRDYDTTAIVNMILYGNYEDLDDKAVKLLDKFSKFKYVLKEYNKEHGNLDIILLHMAYPNFVSTYVIAEVVRKHNRTPEKIGNGLRGIIKEVKSLKDYLALNSKESLIKYLSKMPYDEDMKTLCYKISDSFVKSSNRGSLYGKIYKEDKARRIAKNNAGGFADYAATCLASRNGRGTTASIECYKQGRIPDSQIEKQARRKAVQIFISHVYEAMYMHEFGVYPNDSYPIAHLGHVDYIGPEVDFFKYIKKPVESHKPKNNNHRWE